MNIQDCVLHTNDAYDACESDISPFAGCVSLPFHVATRIQSNGYIINILLFCLLETVKMRIFPLSFLESLLIVILLKVFGLNF